MKHTKTSLYNDGKNGHKGICIGAIDPSDNLRFLMCEVYGIDNDSHHNEESQANAQRIVDCWNACAGIENPEELRRQRDELAATLTMALGDCEYKKHNLSSWHIRAETILAKIKEAA